MWGSITKYNVDNHLIYYDVQTSGGQSGSPIICKLKTNGKNTLWINEKRKIFLDDETLTKNFNEYVYKKMQAAKINDELINQYYAANPPYMSVAGLKRYWEKNDK